MLSKTTRATAASQPSRRTVSAAIGPPHSSSPAGEPSRPTSVSRVAVTWGWGRWLVLWASSPAVHGVTGELDQRVGEPAVALPEVVVTAPAGQRFQGRAQSSAALAVQEAAEEA